MKNPKLETISFDTIAKAVKNCTTPSSVQSFLTWNDFEIDEDATFWGRGEKMYFIYTVMRNEGHFTIKMNVDEALIEESQEAIK